MIPAITVTRKVREGETGNPSRSQPGLRGTRREGGLGRYAPIVIKGSDHFSMWIEPLETVPNQLRTQRILLIRAKDAS
jgi:hypothetical protein